MLYYLYRHKGVMPWEFYQHTAGERDMTMAFALYEIEALNNSNV